jgi:hypothetical protein
VDRCPAPLQVHALKKLYDAVDYHWAEISESVSSIEALSEDTEFPQRDLAAAVASKVRVVAVRLVLRADPQPAAASLRLFFAGFFQKSPAPAAPAASAPASASTTSRCTRTRSVSRLVRDSTLT